MNSRRNFLLRGSMATTALLAVKPFTSFANAITPVTGFSVNDNKIILLHTGDNNNREQAIQQISNLKKNTGNLVIVHAGTPAKAATELNYDAMLKPEHCVSVSTNNYKIIYKGNIKIGIVTANVAEQNTIERINSLSAYLKKEKHCEFVICMSQLGFKNKTTVDDLKLAASSNDIDIIVGGHPDNYTAHPVIAQNCKRGEVILHADAKNGFAFGNIEIDFDDMKNKKSISINNLTARKVYNS